MYQFSEPERAWLSISYRLIVQPQILSGDKGRSGLVERRAVGDSEHDQRALLIRLRTFGPVVAEFARIQMAPQSEFWRIQLQGAR